MLRRLAVCVPLLASSALPALAGENTGHDHHSAGHVAELDGVRIIHAWTRATATREATLFFELENHAGKTISLVGGDSEAGSSVTLVGIRFKDGVAEFVPLPAVPVKSGSELRLDPEGLALRLEGLKASLHKGDVIEVEVQLDIGHLDVDVEVEAEDATGHSHAGHVH